MKIPSNWPRPRLVTNRSIARADDVERIGVAARYLAARRRPAWPASVNSSRKLAGSATTKHRILAQLGPLDLCALIVLRIRSENDEAIACEVNTALGAYTGQTRVALGNGSNLVEILQQIGSGSIASPSLSDLTIAV